MIQTSNMSDAWMPNAFEILLMGGATPTTFTLAQDSTTGAYPTIIPGMLMVLNSDGTVSPASNESADYLGYAYQYCNYNGFSQVDESGSITVVIPGASSIFKFSGPILGSSLPIIGGPLVYDVTSGLITTTGTLMTSEMVINVDEGSVTTVSGVTGRFVRSSTEGTTTTAVSMPKGKSSASKAA